MQSDDDAALVESIGRRFEELACQLVFVHSDIMHGFSVERPRPFDRASFLANHFDAIREVTGDAALWFPAFNYSFPKAGVFRPHEDRSEVGHLSDYVRSSVSKWRTHVPVYSICGTGPEPTLVDTGVIDPFGSDSVFDQLIERDGLVFNYGCDLGSLTMIHYTEQLSGSPYRYEKPFTGRITDATDESVDVTVQFHVRPLNREMGYDWPKLQADLLQQGMLESLGNDDREFQVLPAKAVHAYWQERLADDPLFFLDRSSRDWVEPMLDELGRAFALTDFESKE